LGGEDAQNALGKARKAKGVLVRLEGEKKKGEKKCEGERLSFVACSGGGAWGIGCYNMGLRGGKQRTAWLIRSSFNYREKESGKWGQKVKAKGER